MIHLIPGDPVRAALGPTAPADLVQARRASLGLDDPLLTQYLHYLRGVFTGDLGTSMTTQLPVSELISQRLMATLQLAVLAFLAAVAIAIPVGAAMGALTRGGRARRSELAFTSTSMVLGTIPEFLLGVVLVYVFAVHLGWFPVAGRAGGASYVLPVLSLAVAPAAAPTCARSSRARWPRRLRWPASCASTWCRSCRRTSSARPGPSACRRP